MSNASNDPPIYLVIAQKVREKIVAGELAAGARVPSTNQLARELRINPATANRAFSVLVDEGLLEKRRGIGMFVRPGAREALRTAGREDYAERVLGPVLAQGANLGFTVTQLMTFVRDYFAREALR